MTWNPPAPRIGDSVDRRASYQLEYRARRADGEYRNMLATTNPRYVRRQVVDIARQKLESVGSLASGINNLLAGVLGQAELVAAKLADGAAPEAELRKNRGNGQTRL